MDISGRTGVIAHIGFPTESFKAPLIYNPWFERCGADLVVVPMGCRAQDYAAFLPLVMGLSNTRGALVTMPHKVATLQLVDRISPTARIAGACNAVRRAADGALEGDMFDGEGFVRGLASKGCRLSGAAALVVGAGGVGSAIAASLAAAGVARLSLYDAHGASAEALSARLREHYPQLDVVCGSRDPAGHGVVVNATPLGMKAGDPLPLEVDRIAPEAFVGEVVIAQEMTPLLRAAVARGCRHQVGTDMLFEQIPAYLEFFGLPVATPAQLREVARIRY